MKYLLTEKGHAAPDLQSGAAWPSRLANTARLCEVATRRDGTTRGGFGPTQTTKRLPGAGGCLHGPCC